MATTTTTSSIGAGGEDRVLATAQQIVKSLNTPKEVREDMLLIFSSFDNRLSNIGDLINGDSSGSNRFESAEKIILRSDSNSNWEDSPDQVAEYLEAVDEILQLVDDLSIRSDNEIMDRAESAIQLAMSRLEDEFRHTLIRNTIPLDADRMYGSIRRVSLSFAANDGEISDEFETFGEVGDGSSVRFHERGASLGDDLCVDLIEVGAVDELREIAERMIRSGYEKECVQVYSNIRRDALDECLVILGVEKLSIEEVQRIEWSSLDEKMKKWIQAIKIVIRVLLSGEKRHCDSIFGESDSIGEAMVTDEFVCGEVNGVLNALGGAAKGTFAEFENAVQSETSKKAMQGGEIHPLTRYVMNYVKLLVDYSQTLNRLLENDEIEANGLQGDNLDEMSPIARRLLFLLTTLESNIEEKARLYDDVAMQYIFLMNNILYIVQKVKDSEIRNLLGDNWVRKRRGQVRQYATSYLRATWSRALACLKDEGIGSGSNNASKVALKERFKSFNLCFEEIYRIQTAWKVPDPQLREELRISISEKVIPAYRSFNGRFRSQLESGRHAGKYIKYTPEDLESYVLDLFEGSPGVLHHPRRKST
ncbi:hypothetical protein Q3G72_024600 [Acer saccharum]|nr:hypothetical protein Q3G72_024600 [Acer saccharum]